MVGALGSEHDLPLAVAHHIDGLLDAHAAVLQLLPGVGLDRQAVGKLVVQPEEQLLAGDLGGGLTERRVGELVFRVEPRARRHGACEIGPQIGHAVAVQRRDHEGAGEGVARGEIPGEVQQLWPRHEVDLVEHGDDGALDLGERLEYGVEPRVEPASGMRTFRIDHQCHEISVSGPAPRRGRPWRGRAGASAGRCRACRPE